MAKEKVIESTCPYCGEMMPYGGCRNYDEEQACSNGSAASQEVVKALEESKPERPD
jgi:hypothetical protein